MLGQVKKIFSGIKIKGFFMKKQHRKVFFKMPNMAKKYDVNKINF